MKKLMVATAALLGAACMVGKTRYPPNWVVVRSKGGRLGRELSWQTVVMRDGSSYTELEVLPLEEGPNAKREKWLGELCTPVQ